MKLRLCFAALGVAALLCAQEQEWNNPVIPGDHPDPSVVRVGQDYYATSTSSGWAPIFPLFHSHDLVKWEQVGSVFRQPPSWSAGSYWAPEITYYRRKFFVYYTARKRDAGLCVAVATADRITGPWKDHGPLVCDHDGSIDAMAIDDESGRRYLLWKEDGNSQKLPTPIWAQPLADDGVTLTGQRIQLILNTAPWEGAVVEGPFVLRHEGYFYLFYAGGACCGVKCDYAEGVARSRSLLGPYDKNPNNPIVRANNTWKCPGHGSLVQDEDGNTFFLYHAYSVRDSIYVGREALLDEVTWDTYGWPSVNHGAGPGKGDKSEPHFTDNFTEKILNPSWQWPPDNEPNTELTGVHGLYLGARNSKDEFTAGVLAQSPTHANYSATVRIQGAGGSAGLAGYGDARNALGISVRDKAVVVWRRENGKTVVVSTVPLPAPGAPISLRMSVAQGRRFTFAFSADGRAWQHAPGELEGGYLPPWDMSARIALVTGGSAFFQSFEIGPLARDRDRGARSTTAALPPRTEPMAVYDPSAFAPPAVEAPPPAPKAQPRTPRLNAADFRNPPRQYRPWTVWWWFGNASNEQDLVRELAEMDSHGIGGVEINCVYPLDLPAPRKPDTVQMYSREWQSRLDAVLQEARRRGMQVWLRGGSGWPYGGPEISKPLSSRAVAHGWLDVQGPKQFTIPPPKAARGWTVDALERLVAIEQSTKERRVLEKPNVPPGNWRVYAIYRMFTNQTVKRAAPGGSGLVLDHFNESALKVHLQPLADLMPMLRPYRGTFMGVTSDSLELDDANWTPDFLDQFEKRRGYDLTPRLPDLWYRLDPDSDGIRQDFFQTLSELQIERYFKPLKQWTNENGFLASVQAHGGIAEAIEAYGSIDAPDGETIWPGQDRHQVNMRNRVLAASAAHIYGKRFVSAESYTWLRQPRFLVTLGMMKAASDAIYLDGITQIKNHGYPSSPEIAGTPGWVFYASTMVNHNQTWWPHYPALSAYVARMNYLMQAGDRVADIAIYSNIHDARATFQAPKRGNSAWNTDDDAWHRSTDPGLDTSARISMQIGDCADFLRKSGYGFDVINDDGIQRRLGGLGYRAIVFYATRSVPPKTLQALKRFADQGGLVFAVGAPPEEGVGFADRVDQHMQVVRAQSFLRKVATLAKLREALDASVRPDFRATTQLSFLHRVSEDRHYYFVANPAGNAVTAQVWFRDAQDGVEQWNPMDGTVSRAHNPVSLGPYESTVFVFSKDGPGYEAEPVPSNVADMKTSAIEGPWTVSFPEQSFTWDHLQDWIEVPELKAFSGLGTYRAEFELPEGAKDVAVELGDVRSSADVKINGKPVGISFLPPNRLSIADAVQAGRNTIEVRVANLWSNWVRAQPPSPSVLPGPGYSVTDVLYGPKDRPLVSSGLLGPVRVMWR